MKVQSISPTGIKYSSVNNYSPINQNRFIFNEKDLNKDIYIASRPKVSFGSLPPNFGEVIEGKLFRGGLPNAEDFKELAAKGIKYIIDLCGENSREAGWAKEYGMKYFCLREFDVLNNEHLANVCQKIEDGIKEGGVYVHCDKGETRTGAEMIYFEIKKGVPEKIIKSHYSMHSGYNSFAESSIGLYKLYLGIS